MAKIYLIRHAESLANTRGIYQGQTYDTYLSPLGVRQALALKKRFNRTKIDIVYTSPLIRTRQTAAAFNSTYIDTPLLLETNHGSWEGHPKSDIASRWPGDYHLWQTFPSRIQFPNGEHFSATLSRVITWFELTAKSDLTVVAITHSNVIMALLTHLHSQPLDNMWQYVMQPTAVTLIQAHSPAKIVYLNDISHLKGLESDLSTHAI